MFCFCGYGICLVKWICFGLCFCYYLVFEGFGLKILRRSILSLVWIEVCNLCVVSSKVVWGDFCNNLIYFGVNLVLNRWLVSYFYYCLNLLLFFFFLDSVKKLLNFVLNFWKDYGYWKSREDFNFFVFYKNCFD